MFNVPNEHSVTAPFILRVSVVTDNDVHTKIQSFLITTNLMMEELNAMNYPAVPFFIIPIPASDRDASLRILRVMDAWQVDK